LPRPKIRFNRFKEIIGLETCGWKFCHFAPSKF
jgi:hypothetical protein